MKQFETFVQRLANMSAEPFPYVLSQHGVVTVFNPYLVMKTNHLLVDEGYYMRLLEPVSAVSERLLTEAAFDRARDAWRRRCEFVLDVREFLSKFSEIAKVERKHAKKLTTGYYGKLLVGFVNNPYVKFLFGGFGFGHVEDCVNVFQTKISIEACHTLSSLSIMDKTFASFYSWELMEGLLTLAKVLKFKYLHFCPSTPIPSEFWWSESQYFPAFFAFSESSKPYYEQLETQYMQGFIMPVKYIVPVSDSLLYGGEA